MYSFNTESREGGIVCGQFYQSREVSAKGREASRVCEIERKKRER